MDKAYKRLVILGSIVADTVMCVLPVMSVYLSDGESCMLLVRGYNLMEFSAWGCIPLLAPILAHVILFGCQRKATGETELMILFLGSMVCYVHSLNAARTWLDSLGGSVITYYPGMFSIPATFVMTRMLPKIFGWFMRRNS